MIIRWCIVWMKDVLGMKLSKVASLTLVSENHAAIHGAVSSQLKCESFRPGEWRS